jgi:hypothetical protein
MDTLAIDHDVNTIPHVAVGSPLGRNACFGDFFASL